MKPRVQSIVPPKRKRRKDHQATTSRWNSLNKSTWARKVRPGQQLSLYTERIIRIRLEANDERKILIAVINLIFICKELVIFVLVVFVLSICNINSFLKSSDWGLEV